MMKTLLELHPANDERKLIRLIQGDIMDETGSFDLLICSAYKNRYWVTDRSLIGSLFWERNISIDLLSRSPALNMKDQGFWISDEIDSNFRRIGCIELLDPDHREDPSLTILKSKYAAMRYLLEQASYMGIPVSNIAMTVFGTGEQQLELQYMACVLWEQLTLALQSIDSLTEINIYERDPEITDERHAPTKGYIREAAARNPEIHKDCWIKFMDIRFRLVHTADSQVPVEELTETIIPEFVREYKAFTQ